MKIRIQYLLNGDIFPRFEIIDFVIEWMRSAWNGQTFEIIAILSFKRLKSKQKRNYLSFPRCPSNFSLWQIKRNKTKQNKSRLWIQSFVRNYAYWQKNCGLSMWFQFVDTIFCQKVHLFYVIFFGLFSVFVGLVFDRDPIMSWKDLGDDNKQHNFYGTFSLLHGDTQTFVKIP